MSSNDLGAQSAWRGWLLLLSVTLLSVLTIREIRPFLAVTEPVAGGLMVVEGWVSDVVMEAAIAEFKQHHYEKIFVTGGPISRGAPLSDYTSFAEQGTATLLKLGLDRGVVQSVPATWVRKDRTYASAAALSQWMRDHGVAFTAVHLITEGPHARRSRLLFQRALGNGVTVGVTSVPDREYDPERWWQSSAGVRDVVGETLAYLYARILF